MSLTLAVKPRNGTIPQITNARYCFLGFRSMLSIPLACLVGSFYSGQKFLDFKKDEKVAYGMESWLHTRVW